MKTTTLVEVHQQVDQILAQYQYDKGQLIGILLDIQQCVPMHYIPEDICYYLAEKLSLKITQIYDVVSFYASLYDQPRAVYPIQICNSIVCHINDNQSLFENLQALLGIGLNETTADGLYRLEEVPCFGACDVAPAIRVNGKVYGHLNSIEAIQGVLDQLSKEA